MTVWPWPLPSLNQLCWRQWAVWIHASPVKMELSLKTQVFMVEYMFCCGDECIEEATTEVRGNISWISCVTSQHSVTINKFKEIGSVAAVLRSADHECYQKTKYWICLIAQCKAWKSPFTNCHSKLASHIHQLRQCLRKLYLNPYKITSVYELKEHANFKHVQSCQWFSLP